MEPESSLPYSQVPATCPYPEPAPSSPHNPLPLPEDIPEESNQQREFYTNVPVNVPNQSSFPVVFEIHLTHSVYLQFLQKE
jgi:hypothetical protein